MSDFTNTCLFCKRNVKTIPYSSGEGYLYDCENCGTYGMSREAYYDLPSRIERDFKGEYHLVSGVLREINELNLPRAHIDRTNFESIYNSVMIPKTAREKVDKILLFMYRRTKQFGEGVDIDYRKPAICYARDQNEAYNLMQVVEDKGFIKVGDDRKYYLTLEGHERCEVIKDVMIPSKQAFVAMWVCDDMNRIYSESIAKAIRDAGYEPRNIQAKEFNDEICDHIISEIRKSKFMIADFTGNRDGVYYEAGFARGLGIEVICTCREDWFNKTEQIEVEGHVEGKMLKVKIDEDRKIHFDIDHRKFITWKDGNDLYNQLNKRIKATIIR